MYIYIYIYIKEIIKKRTKRIFHNILVLTFSYISNSSNSSLIIHSYIRLLQLFIVFYWNLACQAKCRKTNNSYRN